MQSVFDLIEKEKEKTKSVFDMVKEPKKQDLPKAEDFKSVFELVQQNKPKQPIQDIAKITPEPVQAPSEPVMGTGEYVSGKVYSTLLEKPIAAMAAPVSSALEKGFRLFGLDDLADQQKEVTELYNKPPVTKKVQEQTAYLREQAYGKGMLQGVGFDVTESVTQLVGLLTQIAATKQIPVLKGKGIMDTFKVMAGHAVATTPGGIDDRLQAAVYRMGYSMTPFIANATGATGLTAVAVDTALNTFLTSPVYVKAFKEAENPEQFFQMAIPQLVMDIGMAWNTRGLPANQRIAEYNKMWNKVENQVSKLKPEEFAKLAEEVDKVYQEQQKMETKTETKEPWEMTEEKFVKENINKSEVGLKDIQNNEVKLNKIEQPTTEKTAEVGQEIIKPENNFSIDERGSVTIPSRELISDTVTKMKSVWDVQAPFIKVGADETGFRLKNYFSEIETGLERGEEVVNKATQIGRKNNLTKDEFTEATYATESPVYKMKLGNETRNKIEPIVKEVNEFYKNWEGKLKEIGWMEEPFPQSLLSRNNKLIEGYQKQLKQDLPKEQKTKLQQSISNLQNQNQKIKDLDLQFVSVPIRMILEGADTAVSKHFMSILPHWGRKTLTIKDLVEEGVLTKEQADIRNVVAEYSDRMSRKYALGQIFKAAEKDGLIAQASEKPDWATFTAKIVPQLKGKVVHPAFNDMLTAFFGSADRGGLALEGAWGNFVGITKMMQFYNPAFLPMYDVIQGAAAGTFTSLKTPKNIVKALQDIPIHTGKLNRPGSPDYYEAAENGLFSKPYSIPFKQYQENIKKMISDSTLKTAIGKGAINPLLGVYQLSWNAAWKGDSIVRMMTYNHLKDKGMTPREAAQTAAMFHGDYASVPPSTRKVLNKIFFTPTFKITMSKLYTNMAKGAAKQIFTPKSMESKDKTYAKGLLLGAAILEGTEFFFTNILGYEVDQKYRKYVKEVETDEGIKESVITIANPLNIPWRYYYRGKSALEDPDLNKLEKIADQVKWELTPAIRVGVSVLENKYEEVYKLGDDPQRQVASIAKYVVKELVAITKPLIEATEGPSEFKTESWEVMQKELGTIKSLVLQPFVFHYARDTKDKRLSLAIYRLQNNFKYALRTAESPEQQQRIAENFHKELKKLQKELDKYYSKTK